MKKEDELASTNKLLQIIRGESEELEEELGITESASFSAEEDSDNELLSEYLPAEKAPPSEPLITEETREEPVQEPIKQKKKNQEEIKQKIQEKIDQKKKENPEEIKQEEGPEDGEEDIERKPKFTPVAFHDACVARIEEHLSRILLKRSRATFSSADESLALICAVSKEHSSRVQSSYWFAFHPHQKARILSIIQHMLRTLDRHCGLFPL